MTKRKERDPLPPFKFTTFSVPGQVNIKNVNSSYLNGDHHTGWAKRATSSFSEHPQQREVPDDPNLPNGFKTIIIHPGSKTIRLGRASDYSPLQVDNIIARERRSPLASASASSNRNGTLSAAETGKGEAEDDVKGPQAMDVDGAAAGEVPGSASSPSPLAPQTIMEHKIASLRQTLHHRTTSLRLRPLPQARAFAAEYNASSRGESVEEFNDPFKVEWDLDGKGHGDVVVGSEVFKLSTEIWDVRRPWMDRIFNERDYSSLQANVADMEEVLREALVEQMKITAKDLRTYSVILVIPDTAPPRYISEMCETLLAENGKLGFKQISVQQESLCATFGAGLSSACVIDIGASQTSIACVEEGMVLPETRHTLCYGGNDITSFLSVLLRESSFPYKELDLAHTYDWAVIEGLKERFCTLSEAQVGVNLYDFFVRRPRVPTKKYTIKTFDEVILAPMCLFEPRVVDFESKLNGLTRFASMREEIEEGGEYALDQPTMAMNHSTFHLRPPPPPPPPLAPAPSALALTVAAELSQPPLPPADPSEPPPSTTTSASTPLPFTEPTPPPTTAPVVAQAPPPPPVLALHPTAPSSLSFSIPLESSKVPLDIAIVNALLSSSTEERIRRLSGSLLLVGGTASLPAMAYALQSRVLPILNARVPSVTTVEVVPSNVDPSMLVWKGGSVLARLEGTVGGGYGGEGERVSGDFWCGRKEWERVGMKGVRERSLFL